MRHIHPLLGNDRQQAIMDHPFLSDAYINHGRSTPQNGVL
jgi:hypothetical protein